MSKVARCAFIQFAEDAARVVNATGSRERKGVQAEIDRRPRYRDRLAERLDRVFVPLEC